MTQGRLSVFRTVIARFQHSYVFKTFNHHRISRLGSMAQPSSRIELRTNISSQISWLSNTHWKNRCFCAVGARLLGFPAGSWSKTGNGANRVPWVARRTGQYYPACYRLQFGYLMLCTGWVIHISWLTLFSITNENPGLNLAANTLKLLKINLRVDHCFLGIGGREPGMEKGFIRHTRVHE